MCPLHPGGCQAGRHRTREHGAVAFLEVISLSWHFLKEEGIAPFTFPSLYKQWFRHFLQGSQKDSQGRNEKWLQWDIDDSSDSKCCPCIQLFHVLETSPKLPLNSGDSPNPEFFTHPYSIQSLTRFSIRYVIIHRTYVHSHLPKPLPLLIGLAKQKTETLGRGGTRMIPSIIQENSTSHEPCTGFSAVPNGDEDRWAPCLPAISL